MIWLRSLLFNVVFFVWSVLLAAIGVPFLLYSPLAAISFGRFWANGSLALLRCIVRLDYSVIGLDLIPSGACIIAMKHQSAWDALILLSIIQRPAVVVKRELLLLPFYGCLAARAGSIWINRKAGASALRHMIIRAAHYAKEDRPIVIFPQGTRVAPGVSMPYQPGVAALYRALQLPIVPVALNSGAFWGRRAFIKRPGTISIEFLPPIPPGWSRGKLMNELENQIETATALLDHQPNFSITD